MADDVFAAAVRYVETFECSVIPLKPGSKVPALATWKDYQERRPTLEELERWFSKGENNVGVVTGAISGLVVVDIDGAEGERSVRDLRFPRTPMVKTPHGTHVFFRHPGTRIPNRAHVAPGVDIRADGGFVVAPPSTTPDGVYAFLPSLGFEVVPCPAAVVPKPWLNGGHVSVGPKLPEVIHDGQERWRHLLSLAGTLRRRGLGESEIVGQLAVFNQNHCRPPKPDADLRRIAAWVVANDSSAPLVENVVIAGDKPRVPLRGQGGVSLSDVHDVFREGLYLPDMTIVDVNIAAVVANLAEADPVFLMTVGAGSRGKTEIIDSLREVPQVYPLSELSKATLLSGYRDPKNPGKDASLLPKLSAAGKRVLLLKDFGTVLSTHRDERGKILAQLREVFDGSLVKATGTGQETSWEGHLGFVAGVTPAIDEHHGVIAILGERFVYLRIRDVDRAVATRFALEKRARDKDLRADRRHVVAELVAGIDPEAAPGISETARGRLIELSDFTTRARTAVSRDGYSREVLALPEAEAPMRFAKQLAALVDALRLLGYAEPDALGVAERIANDSIPPGRRAVLAYVQEHGRSNTPTVATSLGLPTSTTARALEELAMLGILLRTKESAAPNATNWWELSPDG